MSYQCKICGRVFVNKYSHIFLDNDNSHHDNTYFQSLLLPSIIPFRITLYVPYLKYSNYDTSSVYDVYYLLPKTTFKCSGDIYFRCPICLDENSTNPIIFICGHCTCKNCYRILFSSLASSKKCPICRRSRVNNNNI